MASQKTKVPSSSRRHIKLETFSQFVSATRLRHVQNILNCSKVGSPDIDGILCIAGIDSQFNKGMYELFNYLLFDFFDARKEELERSGFTVEIIEDVMILVCPDHVEVYCNPINYHCLLPYISHWPGLKIHCLSEKEYGGEGDDASEEFKIRSFIAMLANCKVVGFPFSGRGHTVKFDVMALEKWPIIQASALDDFGGGGFFTLKYEVVDVSDEVHHLSDYLDPVSVELLLTEHFPLMMRQWNNMVKYIQMALESSSSVIDLKKVSEPLISYFNHGLMGHTRSCVDLVPFLVFGPDTDRGTLQKVLRRESVELSDLSLQAGSSVGHMICQVVSPHSPLMCTRTYFFCGDQYSINSGVNPTDLHHSREGDQLRYLVAVYLSVVKAALSAVEMYAHTSNISKARSECMRTLQESCSKLNSRELAEYLDKRPRDRKDGTRSDEWRQFVSALCASGHAEDWLIPVFLDQCDIYMWNYRHFSNVEFALNTLTYDNRNVSHNNEESNKFVKYVRIALYNLPVPGGSGNDRNPLSLMFAETFLDSRICAAGSCDVSSDYLILTSSVPRHQMWSMSGPVKKPGLEVVSMPVDQWGELLLTQADVHMMGSWTALLPPEKVMLTVYKNGLSVQSYDYGNFSLHGSDVHSMSFYDGNSMSQVAMLVVRIKLTDALTQSLPPHLYAECDDNGVGQILFDFSPHSKAFLQLYANVLPAWKTGSQFPSVERLETLSPQLEFLYTYLQNMLSLLATSTNPATGLRKVRFEMPELFSFLDHLKKSCGMHGPVTQGVFYSLVGTSDLNESPTDENIVVTIVTGMPGSGKEKLATLLTSYNKNITNWLVYKQSEECQVDTSFLHHSMSSAAQSRDEWLLTKSTRLIIVAPGFCDTAEIVRAICYHPDHKLRSKFVIGSVTMCIDPENTFMEHNMTFPMLTGNCAQGWVNNILFTSQTEAQNDLLEHIQTLIRSINTDVALLKADNGLVKRSTDLDLIMSEAAFNSPSMEKARVLLKPNWREGYPHAWPCNPVMKDVVLRFTHPLEKHLTLIKLRGLKSSLKSHPYEGNIYFVRGFLTFSGSPTWVDIYFATSSGKLVMNDVKRASSAGDGTVNFICFTGVGLKERELKEFLSNCVRQRPEKKLPLTRKDLTNEDIDKIHKLHHLDELPAGWYYNGSQYVSMDGQRSRKHPNLEQFIQSHIHKKNAEIEKCNARTESETYVSLWQK